MDKFGNGEARNFHLTVHLILAPKRPQRRGIIKISIQSKVKIEWHHFFSLNSISRLPNYFDFNLSEDRKKNRQEKYHKELNGEKIVIFFSNQFSYRLHRLIPSISFAKHKMHHTFHTIASKQSSKALILKPLAKADAFIAPLLSFYSSLD